MFKFLDRDEAIRIINSWIREGSNLESWGSYQDGEWIVLRGSDGAREEFCIFHSQAAYDEAVNMNEW